MTLAPSLIDKDLETLKIYLSLFSCMYTLATEVEMF